MWIIAGLAALATALVLWQVPARLFVGRIDASSWLALARHAVLLRVVSVTVLHASAQFALFSFLVVAYREALAASPDLVTVLLALTGFAGFVGNVYAGRLADRFGPPSVIAGAIGLMLTAFLVWLAIFAVGPGPLGIALAGAAALLWGAGNFASNSMQQVRLVNLAPPLASVSVALNTSAIYLGQFIGTALGGLVLSHQLSSPATRALPWIGLPIFAVAIGVSLSAQRRAER
jgi:predicted MFS family arabinose efflux permease